MQTRRWVNPTQPQTMQIAVFLLYLVAAETLIWGNSLFVQAAFHGAGLLVRLFITGAGVAAGYGIANERKWAYALGLVVAAIPLSARLYVSLKIQASPLHYDPLGLMFEVALAALLIHPQSRDYQRIWFK